MNAPLPILGPLPYICVLHGTYEGQARFGRPPACPQCAEDSIARIREESRMERARQADATREAAAKIPPLFALARLEDFDAEKRQAALQWIAGIGDTSRTLVVLGPVGTGKTHFGAAIARLACGAGVTTRMVTHANLLREVRASWDSYETNEESVLRKYGSAGLLVLDDAGAARGNDNDVSRIAEIIDDRYVGMRATVITSNLRPEELKIALGDRAYDRIREGAVQLTFTGHSRRRTAA